MSEAKVKWICMAVFGVMLTIALAIVAGVYLNTHNGTERLKSCVEHGGSYLQVPNTDRYECQGAMIHE